MVTKNLEIESERKAVIDSGCTASVAGKQWLKHHISCLPEHIKNQVEVKKVSTRILFGAGKPVTATKLVYLPSQIGSINCILKILVKPGILPFLLSVAALRKAKFFIEFRSLKLSGPCGMETHLQVASSGHILLKIDNFQHNELCLTAQKLDLDPGVILKLHKQFGHASTGKLAALLSKTGGSKIDSSKIEDVVKNCDICNRFGRSPCKPVVSLPLSVEWNHTIAMDLHKCSDIGQTCWYLHIIDVFTRFSMAVFIYDKRPETIIEAILKNWCLIFGFPKVIFTDNGGEFNNKDVHSFAQNYDFVVKTTAAESPFSNGMVERHNAVLTETFQKMRAENTNLGLNTLLQFASFA